MVSSSGFYIGNIKEDPREAQAFVTLLPYTHAKLYN
jgi:hypothetical protein